jgi:hypothetical protein
MPDFFETVDSSGIVENHIQGVLKLEETEARKLLKRYREIRSDLRDRLDSTRADTFTAQQLRGVLAQVDGAISAMNRSLLEGMTPGAERAAMLGIEDLLSEIRTFDKMFTGAVTPINLNVALIAQDVNNLLVSKYQSSLDAYSEQIRSQLADALTNAAIEEISLSQVTQRLGQFFIGEEWKLTQIARTELHGVYNLGKQKTMQETQAQFLPDLQKTLIHPMDSRTGDDSKYAARKNLIVDIDEPFEYTWNGKKRIYMVPPDRPNDRSIMVPYRETWNN